MSDVFFSARHRWEQNQREGAGMNVKRAVQDGPGGQEVGIAVCVLGRAKLVLSPDNAYRLAKDLADELSRLRANT